MKRKSARQCVIDGHRNRVRKRRLAAMITKQLDLAHLTGISRSTINAIENNRQFLSASHAILIAEALKCSLDDLYEKNSN